MTQNLGDRHDKYLPDHARCRGQTVSRTIGSIWRPRNGSHVAQTSKLTSAIIDAHDFIRARKDRKTMVCLPEGTLVAGGKDIADPAVVTARLDKAHATGLSSIGARSLRRKTT